MSTTEDSVAVVVTKNEIQSTKKFYKTAREYWSNVEPTVDGMLGGFEHVSDDDIKESQLFLNGLFKNHGLDNKLAFDGGAGIGRVSKYLLLKNFENVEMLDPIDNFIEEAKSYLGPDLVGRVQKFYISGLETFYPEPNKYDVVWLQWCSGHLEDTDLIEFLKRCKLSLKKNGVCVIKDNIAKEEIEFDEVDSSFVRTRQKFKDIIHRAQMRIIADERQRNFPTTLYEVRMMAFK